MPGGWEWAILLVVVLLLFGAKRLPEMARSLGRSARVLRSELKGMGTDDEPAEKKPSSKPSSTPEPVTGPGPGSGVAPGHSNGSGPRNGIGPANGTEPATGHSDRG